MAEPSTAVYRAYAEADQLTGMAGKSGRIGNAYVARVKMRESKEKSFMNGRIHRLLNHGRYEACP